MQDHILKTKLFLLISNKKQSIGRSYDASHQVYPHFKRDGRWLQDARSSLTVGNSRFGEEINCTQFFHAALENGAVPLNF